MAFTNYGTGNSTTREPSVSAFLVVAGIPKDICCYTRLHHLRWRLSNRCRAAVAVHQPTVRYEKLPSLYLCTIQIPDEAEGSPIKTYVPVDLPPYWNAESYEQTPMYTARLAQQARNLSG